MQQTDKLEFAGLFGPWCAVSMRYTARAPLCKGSPCRVPFSTRSPFIKQLCKFQFVALLRLSDKLFYKNNHRKMAGVRKTVKEQLNYFTASVRRG